MAIDLTRVKLLCFDVDGTLRDTDDAYTLKLAGILKKLSPSSSTFDLDALARRVIMAVESPANFAFSLPDRLGIDPMLEKAGEWLYKNGLFKEKQSHSYLMIEGVHQTLQALQSRFPMVVITARGKRGTDSFLSYSKLMPYFEAVISAQTAQRTKPHPAPVIYAANKMSLQASDCLMIGDTTVDILSGKRAGAQTIGVLSGFGTEKELKRKGADLILNSVAELPQLLNS